MAALGFSSRRAARIARRQQPPRALWSRSLWEDAVHVRTPLFRSNPLSDRLGADVWLKMDALQPSGSFKLLGLGRAVQVARLEGATSIVSSSGGNAGLATAYACRAYGLGLTVVVPASTPSSIVGKLEAYGATAIVHGAAWDDANERAMALAKETDAFLVHPFDDAEVWAGNATLVYELYEDLPRKPGAIVTVCGGGGLACGILNGLDDMGWGDVRLVVCETEGAASMTKSIDAGERVTLPAIESICGSLGARTVSETAFENIKYLGSDKVPMWTTTDASAVRACATFLNDHRVLVEPACGAGLAAVYETIPELRGIGDVVVEVCGGAIVDQPMLDAWRARFGVDDVYPAPDHG